MSWLRLSDDCYNYPKLLEVLGYEPADPRIRLEVFGFLVALATFSAAHDTDYVVNYGQVMAVGLDRAPKLVELCEKVGLLEKISADPVKWKIIEDPAFIHMRYKNDILWDRQQRKDNNDPALTGPVRMRDGDNCRWCGVPVVWRGPNKNARKGTYDHLQPGKPATVETLVVSCLRCNTSKGNALTPPEREKLLSPPVAPRYTAATVEDLSKLGFYVEQNQGYIQAPAVTGQEPASPIQDETVDPVKTVTASFVVESISQATQPADGPYISVASSEKPVSPMPAASQRVEHVGEQTQSDVAPTLVDDAPAWKQPSAITESKVESPANAKTEAVEIPLPSVTAHYKSTNSQVEVTAESIHSVETQSQTLALLSVDSPGRDGSGRVGSTLVGSGRDRTGQGGPGLPWLGLGGEALAQSGDEKTVVKRKRRRRR